MKIRIDIDEKLIKQAIKFSTAKTFSEAVNIALAHYIKVFKK
jgi:Arc/MetJ family transcription regulator